MTRPTLERYAISHPMVPVKAEGLQILHLADPHISQLSARNARWKGVCDLVARVPVDLVALSGDYMTRGGDESLVIDRMRELAGAWDSRLGAVGIFGNHDSPALRARAHEIPGVTWLSHGRAEFPDVDITVLGSSYPEDTLRAASSVTPQTPAGPAGPAGPPVQPPFRILMVHTPSEVYSAHSLGIPLVLAGHTHGGQFRLSPRYAPYTSCSLPSHLATGMLRLGATLCCISRGMGEGIVPARLRCPRQIAVYTLTRGDLPGGANVGHGLTMVRPW